MHLGLPVCLSVCLSVRTRNKKTIAPIDLIFYTRSIGLLYPWLGLPLRRSGSRRNNSFKDSSPLGDGTKYVIKVRHDVKHYDENKRYDVTRAA